MEFSWLLLFPARVAAFTPFLRVSVSATCSLVAIAFAFAPLSWVDALVFVRAVSRGFSGHRTEGLPILIL